MTNIFDRADSKRIFLTILIRNKYFVLTDTQCQHPGKGNVGDAWQ
jgi:hypothetical protein